MLQPRLRPDPLPAHDGDDPAARPAIETLHPAQKALVFVFLAVAGTYLVWRAGTLNPAAPVFSGLIYGAELFGFVTALLHLFMVWGLTVRRAPPPEPGLNVDVFVPTYNEPVDLLRRTLLAARNMDYPHQTWLLDDGDRPQMAALARELGVRYLARRDNTHAKAGNLNHALAHSQAEFVAVFDADHAPKRNFLTETLGSFRNPKLAFVQTPQDFFNLDSYQHRRRGRGPVWTEQSLFFRVIQRGKDRWNAAFFCGSCAVIRRSALDAIGGFQTRTVTEDLETSVALHRAGYESAYLPEPLAFGLAPAAASPFLKQRVRWGQGAMQVIRREWFFLRGQLTLAQRLNYMASTLTYFDGWQKAVFFLAPVWVLFTGTMPLVATAREFLPLFVPYLVLTFWVFEEVGRGYGRAAMIEQYNMARFAAFAWSTLGLLRRNLRFGVTPKDGLSPRHVEAWTMAPQIAVSVLNVLAIAAAVALWPRLQHLPLWGLVANVVWGSVNALVAFAVVRFTLARSDWRRREYRFPIPLPAWVRFAGDEAAMMTVQDISPAGCRLHGWLPPAIAAGDVITGELVLPDGRLPFRARVAALIRNRDDTGVRAVGLEFELAGADLRDRLDLFLYGSDLQWRLHGLKERIRTPLEALLGNRRGTGQEPAGNWTAAAVVADPGLPPVLLSPPLDGSGRRLMASYRRLDGAPSLRMREHGPLGERLLDLRPQAQLGRADTPTGDIYLTEMVPC